MIHRHCLIAVAGMLGMAGSAFGYNLNNIANAGGWDDINKSSTTTVVIDESDFTTDSATGAVNAAVRNSFATWDAVTTAPGLNFDIKPDNGGNYDLVDGPAGSVDQSANYSYANITMGGWLASSYFTEAFGSGGSRILAVTWSGRVGRGRNATWFADTYFNDGSNWTTDGSGGFDIETVMTHELGHALGFDHEDAVPSVMATYYSGINRDLYADDIDGLTALYAGPNGHGKGGGGKGKPHRLEELAMGWGYGADIDIYNMGVTIDAEADFFFPIDIPTPTTGVMGLAGLAGLMIRRRRSR